MQILHGTGTETTGRAGDRAGMEAAAEAGAEAESILEKTGTGKEESAPVERMKTAEVAIDRANGSL